MFWCGTHHVTRLDDVDSDVGMSPLDSQRAAEVTDSGLGSVVGSLRLRNVDDGTAHTSDENDATRSLALHKVTSDSSSEQVGAVDVDTPELSHTVNGILDGVEVLGEAC